MPCYVTDIAIFQQPLARNDFSAGVREDDFHATIQLTIGSSVVAGNGIILAVTVCADTVTADPLVDQSHPHRIGTPLRERLIVAVAASAVCVSLDRYLGLRGLLEEVSQLLDVVHPARFQLCLVGTEQYVAECDHHALLRFLGIQLLELLFLFGNEILVTQRIGIGNRQLSSLKIGVLLSDRYLLVGYI